MSANRIPDSGEPMSCVEHAIDMLVSALRHTTSYLRSYAYLLESSILCAHAVLDQNDETFDLQMVGFEFTDIPIQPQACCILNFEFGKVQYGIVEISLLESKWRFLCLFDNQGHWGNVRQLQ